jgi:hypothetical protein
MASWASVAKASPAPVVPTQDLTADKEGLRLLVVDANAIISGLHLEGIADRAVTIQEVFDEIRDKKSRQFLAALPYQLHIREPAEESVKLGEQQCWPTAAAAAAASAATAASGVTAALSACTLFVFQMALAGRWPQKPPHPGSASRHTSVSLTSVCSWHCSNSICP